MNNHKDHQKTNIKRVFYLDVAKVLTTLLVVYGHLISIDAFERDYIYAFHMPLFFLISGILHKDRGTYSENIKSGVLKLLVPAVFFIVLYKGYTTLMKDVSAHQFSPLAIGWDWICCSASSIWASFRGIHSLMGNGVCWFLFALFWCKLLTFFYSRNKWILLVVIILASTAFYFGCNLIFFKQGFINFPFYLGAFLFKDKIMLFVRRVKAPLLLSLICFGSSILMTYFNGSVSFLSFTIGTLPMPINILVYYINALVASLGIVLISSCIKKESSYITNMSAALLSVVGLQEIFFNTWLHFYSTANVLINVSAAIIIMILCYGSHSLLRKYCPKMIGHK